MTPSKDPFRKEVALERGRKSIVMYELQGPFEEESYGISHCPKKSPLTYSRLQPILIRWLCAYLASNFDTLGVRPIKV